VDKKTAVRPGPGFFAQSAFGAGVTGRTIFRRYNPAVKPQALIVHGGWEGHQPAEVAGIFSQDLADMGFETILSDSLDAFLAIPDMPRLRLIVPVWTMGRISTEQLTPVLDAVGGRGVGLAGCHGGMCDAFRESTEWQFLTGGQWVAHPGNDGVRYTVQVRRNSSPIVDGIPDFEVVSEQYYMHIDPAIRVLATTRFPVADGPHVPNGAVEMPVFWTKSYGLGRIFYSALGHQADIVRAEPHRTVLRRGMRWAANVPADDMLSVHGSS
jgi:type 1 glutamine amidotransferase